MRYIMFAALVALFAVPVSSVDAGIIFGAPVNLNFSAVDDDLNDILNVTDINFGSENADNGRIAVNGTDLDGNGFLSPGDTTILVGHSLIDQVTTLGGVEVDPLDAGQPSPFNLVGVLRNVTGDIVLEPLPFPGLENEFDGGFIDFYLDQDPETPFDPADLSSSVDDTLVGSFAVIGGQTDILSATTGNTRILAELVSNPLGFFGLPSGLDPTDGGSLLNIRVDSVDQVLTNATIAGISGGANGGVDIGAGFSPDGLLDIVSSVDGNADFGTVPEPTGVFIWSGIVAICLNPRRRRA